jgi:hypothetical protein
MFPIFIEAILRNDCHYENKFPFGFYLSCIICFIHTNHRHGLAIILIKSFKKIYRFHFLTNNCLCMRQSKISGMMKPMLWALYPHFSFSPSFAQKTVGRIITGKVIADVSRNVLAGVSVTVKGTRNSIVTGDDGEFSIMPRPGCAGGYFGWIQIAGSRH